MLTILALSAALLAGCGNISGMLDGEQPPDGPDPDLPLVKINIIIKPEFPYNLHEKKALFVPLQMADSREDRWETALTNIAYVTFLQERLFKVIERYHDDTVPLERIRQEASERGFDYIITGHVPNILVPSGNSAGWIGLNLKIQGTMPENSYTLWQIYGGAELKPHPTQHDVLGTSSAINAPSVTTGFFYLTREMARAINNDR
jgi:hypothetical protein